MYNFRYHLVTIVSIFAALMIGLLLGVALTGSDLVRDASSNLAQSLTAEFEELNAENDILQRQLQTETQFADEILSGWKAERLKGRTIVIFERAGGQSAALTSTLSNYVNESGGTAVVVRINAAEGFALDEEQRSTARKRIVKEVEGEEYSTTIAKALAKEWSFAISDDDTIITSSFDQNYELTDYLVALDVITVSVDYSPVVATIEQIQLNDPQVFSSELAAYNQAQRLQLPYAVNGMIDTAVAIDGEDVRFDADVLRISMEFDALGKLGELPYLDLSDDAAVEDAQTGAGTGTGDSVEGEGAAAGAGAAVGEGAAAGAAGAGAGEGTTPGVQEGEQTQVTPPVIPENANYFTLLVSTDEHASAALSAAQNTGITCVFTPFSPIGHYNIVALLSGSTKGSYGAGHQGVSEFAPSPGDESGLLPFN